MSENLRLVWDEKQPERLEPEVKEKWLKALREGEYPQTQGCLQRTVDSVASPKGYCCLGVLADTLIDDEEKVVWRFNSTTRNYGFAVLDAYSEEKEYYVEELSVLPEPLAKRLGMSVDGVLAYFDVWNHSRKVETCTLLLTVLNDNGFTFSQIADLVEYFL